MVCSNKEVSSEFLPFLRVYKDGSVERFLDSPYVPPSTGCTGNNVSSKDITITGDISARIYIPNSHHHHHQLLPVLLYFHGGGFCIESAFSFLSHRYITALVSQAKILVVSVEYRRAPENPLPAAYQDSWTALQWIDSQSVEKTEPWLSNHANFNRVFVGGDSAGANIAHNLAMKAMQNKIHLYGVLLSQPYFLAGSSERYSINDEDEKRLLLYRTWEFVYPNAPGGFDNPLINPFSGDAPSLSWLGGSRLLVCVAEKDELREKGVRYFDAVKKSGWRGKMEFFEVEGEDHCFHIFNLDSKNAQIMIKRLASFLNS